MSPSPTGSTEARSVVVEDDEQSFQERLQALEERERRVLEAERLAHDSGCRMLMGGKMVPVFTLEAEASCDSLERPVASASKEELQRILLRICSVSKVARAITTEMLSITTESATSTVATGSKRKPSDAETIYRCSRCKLRFETIENLPKDCIHHPGKQIPTPYCAGEPKSSDQLTYNSTGQKEVDDDARRSDRDIEFWADHDEDCHGIREDLADEPDYARGFIWSCCNHRGDADGCRTREHDVWINRASASKEERYSFADLVGFA